MLFSTFLTVAKNPFLKLLQNESKLLLGPVHQGNLFYCHQEIKLFIALEIFQHPQ